MRFIQLLVFSVSILPALALALGLGKLQSESALNEPFSARIDLISPTVQELDSLNVRLAGPEAFERAGIPRPRILTDLRFSIKQPESGADYIRIYTDEPVREPFLNFLIEVSWSNGRLFREYTVLLDPPVYATAQTQKKLVQPSAREPVSAPGDGDEIQALEDNNVVYNPEYRSSRVEPAATRAPAPPAARSIDYSGGDYGPVVSGDTLWSIASAMRPDSSISTQQMMLALLRANPEAFINNNINGLKRGHVLKMPDLSGIQSVNRNDAFAEAKLQNNLWEEARGALATSVTPRPESTTVTEQPDTPAPAATPEATTPAGEDEAQLRLVAPSEEGTEGEQDGSAASETMAQELALADESLEALKLENAELRDKLSETEAIIDDLNRLIVLKESELAELQQQIATAQLEKEKAAAAAREEAAKADTAAPVAPEEKPATPEKQPAGEEVTAASDAGEAPAADEPPAPGSGITSLITQSLAGIVDTVRNNLLYIAAAVIALLLLVVGGIFVKRRREGAPSEIPQSAFPEFDEADSDNAGADEITDLNPELDHSGNETLMPGADDETISPEFSESDDATQIMSPVAEAETGTDSIDEEAGEEADPLAEVNVFLAYEHFDQAEEFVKDALEKQPDNLEFHTKLLEVYYAANNRKGYEEAAKVLHDKVNGEGDYWNMAVAMWQEMSPNRELFAEPVAGEEEETAAGEGGGVLNIAGEEEGGGGGQDLDLDFGDTDAGQEMDTSDEAVADDDADILDVTAAIDIDDDEEMLDVTAAAEESDTGELSDESDEDSLDLSFDEPESGDDEDKSRDDNSLDFSMDMSEDETVEKSLDDEDSLDISLGTDSEEKPADDDALDLSFNVGGDDDEPEAAGEDNSLEMSLESESDAGGDDALDISLDISQTGGAAEEVQGDDETSLDFSMDLESEDQPAAGEDKGATADDSMDLSFDTGGDEEAEGGEDNGLDISLESESDAGGDDSLDFSMDLESEDQPAGGEDKGATADDSMDLSFDTGGDEKAEGGEDSGLDMSLESESDAGGDDSLDFSLDISQTGDAEESPADEDSLDLSFDTPEPEEKSEESSDFSLDLDDSQDTDDSDLLDVSSSPASDSEIDSGDDDLLDVSKNAGGEDLLDVTKTSNYQHEQDEDLLDVTTSSTSAGMDADELLEKDDSAEQDDAGDADTRGLDFNLDDESDSNNDSLDFELSPDESESEADSLDFNIDMEESQEPETDGSLEIDMDATMQMPKRGQMDEEADSDDDDNDDQTIMVPRSGDTDEQSEEDEIASQLDLAKAYVELGDTDNAKTILNEVIAIGNDSQREQAEELLAQL